MISVPYAEVRQKYLSALFYLVIDRGFSWEEADQKIAEARPLTISSWNRAGKRSWRQAEIAFLRLIAKEG